MKKLLILLVCMVLLIPAFACAQEQADEALYPAKLGELWGYINRKGETVIEPQWSWASDFRCGYAIVAAPDGAESEDDGSYDQGVIDRTGAYVLEPHYSIDTGYDGEYFGGRDTGVLWAMDEEGRLGFFNLPTGYFSGTVYDSEVSMWVSNDSNLMPYMQDGLYGIIDRSNGNVVIPCTYEYEISAFEDGFGHVQLSDDPDDIALIDETGKLYTAPEGTTLYANAFCDGLIEVQDAQTGLYGYADKTGALVIPTGFTDTTTFSEGCASVQLDGRWGHIDTTGKWIVEPCYDSQYTFHNGLAVVNENSGKATVIDVAGNVVFTMDNTDIGNYCDSGVASYTPCTREEVDEEDIGFVDSTGKVILKPGTDIKFSFDFSDGFLDFFQEDMQVMTRGGLYGFINRDGAVAIDFIWTTAYNFHNGLARVYDANDRMAYIDYTGAIVWQQP